MPVRLHSLLGVLTLGPLALAVAGCELFDESYAPVEMPGSLFVGGPLPEGPVALGPGPTSALLEGRFRADGADLWFEGANFAGLPVRFVSSEGVPFAVDLPDLRGRAARIHARLSSGVLEVHGAQTEP